MIDDTLRCPVLVVDKQAEMGTLVERILGKEGYPTVWVRDSRAALEQIEAAENPIGLLILEAVMPEVPANEIIAAAGRRNPACKIIVISGHMMDAAILDGIDRGLVPQTLETLRCRYVASRDFRRLGRVTPHAGRLRPASRVRN